MTTDKHESYSAKGQLPKVLVTIRTFGIVVLMFTVITLALVLLRAEAPSESESVMAEEFLLTDNTGKTRAKLGMDGNSAGLTIYDRSGNGRLVVKVGEDGSPEIVLMDAQQSKRAQFTLSAGKNPELIFLYPGKPNDRVKLGLTEEGEGYLRIFDPKIGAFWVAPQGSGAKSTQVR